MSEIFHKFSQLPWELRNRIWELATRSTCPGVHFFRVDNCPQNRIVNFEDSLSFGKQCYELHPSAPAASHKVEAPASLPGVHSFTELFDGGLWTACKQSRLVMERKFNSHPWKAARQDLSNQRREARISDDVDPPDDMTPTAGYFVTSNAKKQYFTCFLHQEIFCIQPRDLESFNWQRVNFRVPVGSAMLLDEGLKHVAVEFDPAWGAAVRELSLWELPRSKIVKHFVDAVFDLTNSCNLDTFWFIDYRIKRKPFVPTEKQAASMERRVFRHGNYQFREVPTSFWEVVYEVDDRASTPSIDFVTALHWGIRLGIVHVASTTVIGPGAIYEMYGENSYPAQIGILACEYL